MPFGNNSGRTNKWTNLASFTAGFGMICTATAAWTMYPHLSDVPIWLGTACVSFFNLTILFAGLGQLSVDDSKSRIAETEALIRSIRHLSTTVVPEVKPKLDARVRELELQLAQERGKLSSDDREKELNGHETVLQSDNTQPDRQSAGDASAPPASDDIAAVVTQLKDVLAKNDKNAVWRDVLFFVLGVVASIPAGMYVNYIS